MDQGQSRMKVIAWLLAFGMVGAALTLALRSGTSDPWSGWAGGTVGAFIGVWAALMLAHLQERDMRATQQREQVSQARQARRTEFAQKALELEQAIHRLKWVFSNLRQIELFIAFTDPTNARQAVWVFDAEYRRAYQRAEAAVDAIGQLRALPLRDDHTLEGRFGHDLTHEHFYEAGEFLDTLSKNYPQTLEALFKAAASVQPSSQLDLEAMGAIFHPATVSLYYEVGPLNQRVTELLEQPL